MPRHRLSKAIISQLHAFTQPLGEACPKPSRKFLKTAMLGLAMSGSVMLSEVARKLHGLRAITFHALHKGLCRGLKSKQWSALPVHEAYLRRIAPLIPRDAIMACDLGDITKPRARKMPGLRTVRDGSTGQLKKGWWLVEIEAVFGKQGKHLPLWLELFSVGRRGYKSQREMVQLAISTLVKHLGKRGLWVFDRGFDNWRFFAFLQGLSLRFLVRLKSNRHVVDARDGKKKSLLAVAHTLESVGQFLWSRRRKKTGYVIRVGYGAIEMPDSGQKLWLIVARGFGRHPMMLVSNEPIEDASDAARLVRCYLKRWGVEEGGRLLKQAFRLENLRVLSWAGLVKLTWLTLWTYALLCLMRIKARQVYAQLLKAYPAFGRVPRFPYYRIAGGLAYLLLVGALADPPLLSGLWKSG